MCPHPPRCFCFDCFPIDYEQTHPGAEPTTIPDSGNAAEEPTMPLVAVPTEYFAVSGVLPPLAIVDTGRYSDPELLLLARVLRGIRRML